MLPVACAQLEVASAMVAFIASLALFSTGWGCRERVAEVSRGPVHHTMPWAAHPLRHPDLYFCSFS